MTTSAVTDDRLATKLAKTQTWLGEVIAGNKFYDASNALEAMDLLDSLARRAADAQAEREVAVKRLTRPIDGIENRTAQEVFDIMSDRIRWGLYFAPQPEPTRACSSQRPRRSHHDP